MGTPAKRRLMKQLCMRSILRQIKAIKIAKAEMKILDSSLRSMVGNANGIERVLNPSTEDSIRCF